MENIGIVGIGIYLPYDRMSAKDISEATKGVWAEEAVIKKLGIIEKPLPGKDDGTQEMAVKAANEALEDSGIKPEEIDVILCMGEEWKEYPLTTSALYVQGEIGAVNAWGIDLQNRCSTTVTSLKIAKDLMTADDNINTLMIVGGYRNCDFINYEDKNMSMMYNLSAGGGAIILQKGVKNNLLLGSHIISDGTMSRDAGVYYGGINHPITAQNTDIAYRSLQLFRPTEMKDRLNEVSMDNWMKCIDSSLKKSGMSRSDIDYVAVLHIKRSMHSYLLNELGLTEENSIYLEEYGHIGQVDQILSLKLGLEQEKIKQGSNILMIAAGIGYVWAASVIKWGGK